MPEVVHNCPLCHHESNRPFDTRQFRGYTVSNRICVHCGLVYQSPRMTAAELDEFYAAEYRQVYQGNEGPSEKDLLTQQGRATSLLEIVRAAIPVVDRHLDIGCSAGILLTTFRDHYGCQTVGVEPGEAYRMYAQKQGLTVYPDITNLQAAGEAKFNLISLAHVLEHLPDPVGYIADLREKHLTPQGWLLIEVPNLYCHDSFEIAHLTSFSAHTLRQTVQQAGFEIVMLKKHGQPRSDLLPLYLTLLARPHLHILSREERGALIRGEGNVALKRHLGMLRRRTVQKLFPKKAWLP
jgi:2-polyprenyl-3-methyl-5-hydroxy-6-metoxy-1,4-benzoquinol methylase